MTSLRAALSFLSYIGFSPPDARAVMHRCDDQMSRLMISSHRDLARCDLSMNLRLRLLRAIRCFHMEKWSKYLMNHFHVDNSRTDRFERLVSHLMKYHIWIIYASWTIKYIEKYLVIGQNTKEDELQFFYEKIQRLSHAIVRLKQMIVWIEKHVS